MGTLDEVRRVIESLARLDRASCSPGERTAARWIADEFRAAGARADVEVERVHGTYWWPLGLTSAAGVAAAVLGRRKRRLAGGALGTAAAAAVVDDLSAGRRWLRAALPKRTTANVVATAGDPDAARTLVLVAHHDAAHTGMFFDPRLTSLTGKSFPPPPGGVVREHPVMVPMVAAPAVSGLAALLGARRVALLGGAACAAIVAALIEVAQRPTVPGANDNLTGVAVLVATARHLQQRPVPGLRVLLVSTGAEEALMEGMAAFAARHFGELDRDRTHVLCLDTVGSPHLVLPAGEGMLRVRSYDTDFAELISTCAEDAGITLHRGFRLRLGTDCYPALRHGFRSATLMSLDDRSRLANYHWPTDTPEGVDYDNVVDVARLCEQLIHHLAAEPA